MQIYSHFHRGDYDRRHLLRESGKHRLVEKTLTPLEESRRAFRLVGDILVERTVGEVLPSVESNRKNVRTYFHLYRIRVYLLIILKKTHVPYR
mmetsp:Transcript_32070/g.73783  ORF Transcript_32070/g.73783 Transcript_32070/m.73783 type:complete len:93 (-) Transcript_32070:452-730(-)